MRPPDAHRLHDPNPKRMREMLRNSGVSTEEAATVCGVGVRTLERYLSRRALDRGDLMPYPLQYALEQLCWHKSQEPPVRSEF